MNSMTILKRPVTVLRGLIIGFSALLAIICLTPPAAATGTITPSEVLPPQIGAETGLGTVDLRITIARIIRVAMGLLGIVAVVIVLLGGFTWMTAGGNEEKVAEAKKFIYSGVIGIAIILSAYAIASFVITQLVAATTTPGPTTL